MPDLQTLVDDLAAELGRSVVVNDPAVRMLVTSRHFGDEDEVRVRAVLQRDAGPEVARYVLAQGVARWGRSGIVAAQPALGLRARLCVPVRERGELLGLLMVIDADGSLSPAQVRRIEEVAAAAAPALAGGSAEARAAESLLVEGVMSEDEGRRRAAVSAAAARGLPTAGPVVVTVVTGPAGAGTEGALRAALGSAAHRHRSLVAVDAQRGTIIHTGLDAVGAAAVARRMVDTAAGLLAAPGVVAGVGETVDGLDRAWRSGRRAAAAARGAAAGIGGRRASVVRWSDLGPYALFLQLPPEALTPALIPDPVARLLADPRSSRLVETLRTYLDLGGSMPRTADALHLHRTSLYYRLDRIREITGLDLHSGADRHVLHTGLLLADLIPTDRGKAGS
ncbi:helix-turn-helix domain-containing protein [Pseudonocardia xishanensis]|uniref:PucR-like helix-turn-helix protein n=1 Tax=Pseudonocardia xishanensis TaxID=630995 RepID=A0ABP8S1Y4_9PSEU